MRCSPSILVILILILATLPALADWSHDPTENNLLQTTSGSIQGNAQTLPDGAGGMFMVWSSFETDNFRVRAQRYDAGGEHLWGASGVLVCTYDSRQVEAQLVSDLDGGIIVAWTDETTGGRAIFAQRLDEGGNLLWNPAGQVVCSTGGAAKSPVAASDGFGGAVFGWLDGRNTDTDIYAQRLNASGTRLWDTQGAPVCTLPGNQGLLCIVQDGIGGATLAWGTATSEDGLRAQRLTQTGAPRWTVDGILLDTAYPYALQIDQDGSYGYYLSYMDYVNPGCRATVMRLDSQGESLFPYGYLRAGAEGGEAWDLDTLVDSEGNLFLTWRDVGVTPTGIRAQKVSSGGFTWWDADGIMVAAPDGAEDDPRLVLDGQGGVFVAWKDERHSSQLGKSAVYAQRLDAFGEALWAPDGNLVTIGSTYNFHSLCADEIGGMIAVWGDSRYVATSFFGQRLDATGHLGHASPALTAVQDLPNDQGGQVELAWNASYLDAMPWRAVDSYSVWMRQPDGKARPGSQLDAKELQGLSERLGCTEGRLRDLTLAGWTYLQEVPAALEEEYGCLAATYGDSTGSGVILSEYRILAHGDEPWLVWESQPLSGYSVDNLAPGAPLTLTAQWNAGDEVLLQWQASGHHDEDLASYNVYRSSEPGFVPDPSLLIGTSVDTEFLDPAGAGTWYYRVSAVDVHGNEGEAGNEAALSSASPAPEALPDRCVLHGNFPNPFNPATAIAFALPEGRRVHLAVFSVKGERVAVLADRQFAAGSHTVGWDGKDQEGRAVPAGLYFARMVVEDFVQTRGMILVK